MVMVVMNLRCSECGTRFYSAAPAEMVERGERCEVCAGELRPYAGEHEHAERAENARPAAQGSD
jgi:NAD-dependent SIR2 family protein deacetylase